MTDKPEVSSEQPTCFSCGLLVCDCVNSETPRKAAKRHMELSKVLDDNEDRFEPMKEYIYYIESINVLILWPNNCDKEMKVCLLATGESFHAEYIGEL